MINDFKVLKNEVVKMVENISGNDKAVINYINVILEKFGSKLTVRKNMSIKSFKNLLVNSSTPEEFTKYLDKLDFNKDYLIEDLAGINESIEFNEKYYGKDSEEYKEYKRFLDSRIKLSDNLFIIEYK